jgi:SAM-dependent methyltransferase
VTDSGAEYREYEHVSSCPLCGSPDRTIVDTGAAVVRCRRCGHRFVDPRPTQAEIARGYSLPTTYDDWIQEAEARDTLWRRRFERTLGGRPPGRLLDVGAGIGTFLAVARDRGWSVEGTEISTTAIDHARQRHGIAIRPGPMEVAAPPGPYDVVTLWHVLEHLPDPAGTIRLCHQLLCDEGRLILAMPNDGAATRAVSAAGNLARRLLRRPMSSRYVALRPAVESHIQHFHAGSIQRLLRECGFAVVAIGVDDARPSRSRVESAVFMVRRGLTRFTPWNFGRDLLVMATRVSKAR